MEIIIPTCAIEQTDAGVVVTEIKENDEFPEGIRDLYTSVNIHFAPNGVGIIQAEARKVRNPKHYSNYNNFYEKDEVPDKHYPINGLDTTFFDEHLQQSQVKVIQIPYKGERVSFIEEANYITPTIDIIRITSNNITVKQYIQDESN